jgi:hypothetical protein
MFILAAETEKDVEARDETVSPQPSLNTPQNKAKGIKRIFGRYVKFYSARIYLVTKFMIITVFLSAHTFLQ